MITAIPVPFEPKPLPNRTIDVCNVVSDAGLLSLSDEAVVDNPYTVAPGYTRYLLPGTALAAALAELEEIDEEIEKELTSTTYILSGLERRWLEARRNVKALTPKGTNP